MIALLPKYHLTQRSDPLGVLRPMAPLAAKYRYGSQSYSAEGEES